MREKRGMNILRKYTHTHTHNTNSSDLNVRDNFFTSEPSFLNAFSKCTICTYIALKKIIC